MGASASTCWGSRTWIGPNRPAYSPIQASTNRTTQPADTRPVGSASPLVAIVAPHLPVRGRIRPGDQFALAAVTAERSASTERATSCPFTSTVGVAVMPALDAASVTDLVHSA